MLQQASLRALMMNSNDNQSLSMHSNQYINDSQVMSIQQLQHQQMMQPLQPPALAVPSFNPSNFHTVPVNR